MKKKEEKFDNEFNELFKQKKISFHLVRACIYASVIIVIASLIFCYFMYRSAYNTIAVLDTNGEYLQMRLSDKLSLQEATLKQTCANLSYYLNSFDDGGYLKNYNQALNYCLPEYANRITDLYKAEGSYTEAIQRGVIFITTINEFKEIKLLNDGTAFATFTSLMEKRERNFSTYFLIRSEGKLSKVTPEYPNNVTGWRFVSYKQEIEPYDINTTNNE